MSFVALLLAVHAFGGSALPPAAPVKLWDLAWQQKLVPATMLDWRPQERGGPTFDPVHGWVIVGTRDGWVHARAADGSRVWDFHTEGGVEAAPCVQGDGVFVGSNDGKLYALDLATGKLRWQYDAQEEVGTTPVMASGIVLVMTLQDTLIAVDAQTGAWKWHHRREARDGFSIRGAADVSVSGGLAIGAYSDGSVAALEIETGAIKWEKKLATGGEFTDVDDLRIQGDRVFAASYSGGVVALDLHSGEEVWRVQAPGASRLAVGGGLLVAVAFDRVLGISARDGQVRWTTSFEGAPGGSPVLIGGRAVVPASGGLLFLDTASGRAIRSFDPGSGVSATPASNGSRLFILSNGGDLYAMDVQ